MGQTNQLYTFNEQPRLHHIEPQPSLQKPHPGHEISFCHEKIVHFGDNTE